MTDREQKIARLLRRRRYTYRGAMGVLVALVGIALLDHAGAFGTSSQDWTRFNRHSFAVARVVSGDELVIRDPDGVEQAITLVGVDAPDPPDRYWSSQAMQYLSNRTKDRSVIVRFDATRSRDARGNLLAYVYITDGDNLNLDIIKDGQAFADRRQPHTLKSQFEAAESEARKKPRGMWKELKFEDQPPWRREWLESLKKR